LIVTAAIPQEGLLEHCPELGKKDGLGLIKSMINEYQREKLPKP
jgi:hypothetical protein